MVEAQKEFIKGMASILNITDEKILNKAVELVTQLNLKPQLSCSATCKGVICLDIASSFTSNPINKENAIKYSGCKKRNYITMYNTVAKLLNLDKVYSVKEICLLANACDVKETAAKLFDTFKSQCHKIHYDFEHPMYGCAAVGAVCRSNKMKINYSKLVEISRVKKTELDLLIKKFQEMIDVRNSKEEPKKIKTLKCNTETSLKTDNVTPSRKRTSKYMTDNEYMEWKRRMLEE